MPELKPKVWNGGDIDVCDICESPITQEFVDGATCRGPWAIMCLGCFRMEGRGLGLGKGQYYELSEGQFVKVGG